MRDIGKAGLIALGALHPRAELSSTPPVVDDARVAVGIVGRQKAVGLATERLDALTASDARSNGLAVLAAELAPIAERCRHRAEGVRQAAAEVQAIAERTGVRAYPMKGLAFRAWYANPDHRDVGDLDLLVPEVDDGWALTTALRAAGWTYQENELPWFKRDLRSGSLYGQARMRSPVDDDRYIDIHFGRFYSVRHCAVMPMATPEGSTLGATENLAAMVGNAANDHFITMKDVNDLWLALGRSDVDWERLVGLLRQGGITGFLTLIVRRMRRYLSIDDRRLEVLASMRLPRPPTVLAPSHTEWGWRRRWLATSLHTAKVAARTPGLGLLRTTRDALYYYARPLHLRVVDTATEPVHVDRADNATCIRLVPRGYLANGDAPAEAQANTVSRALPGSAVIRVVGTAHGDLVLSRDDVFVPTVDYTIGRRLVTAAAGVAPVTGGAGD